MIFLLYSLLAHASYQFEGQFHYSPIEPTVATQGASVQTQVTNLLKASAGVRVALATWEVDRMEYAGTLSFTPIQWISFNLRLNQQAVISIGSGSTDLLATMYLETYPFSFLGFFAEGGWFERWIALSATPLVPGFSSVSVRDHDFALHFGIHIRPISRLLVTLSVGTIEDILVFNFNNPFAEVRTSLRVLDSEIFAFGRYKLLLGFGRLDEFAAGVGIKLDPERI